MDQIEPADAEISRDGAYLDLVDALRTSTPARALRLADGELHPTGTAARLLALAGALVGGPVCRLAPRATLDELDGGEPIEIGGSAVIYGRGLLQFDPTGLTCSELAAELRALADRLEVAP